MARYVLGGEFGRQVRSTLRSTSSAGQNSVREEPTCIYIGCSSCRHSLGNGNDIGGKDHPFQSGTRHSCRRATGVRASLVMDHFATLGIRHNASKSEIKSAYRNLAKLYHPDVCRGDQCQLKFIQISTAYENALNCTTRSDSASNAFDDEDFSDECREELDEWEEWMGWEGAGTLDYSN